MIKLILAAMSACAPEELPSPPDDTQPEQHDSGVGGDSSPVDSEDPEEGWEECEPLTLSVVQEWEETDLPDWDDSEQRRPGLGLGDLDGDGDLDLLMVYGGGSMGLRNDGKGLFTEDDEITVDGERIPSGSAVSLIDLDGDGDLDGYLGRQWQELDQILWNDGTGKFTSQPLLESNPAPASAAFGDLDGDHDLDLVVGTVLEEPDPWAIADGEEVGEGPAVYIQEAGEFTRDDSRLPPGLSTAMTWEAELLDYDLDGDLDIYLANDFGNLLVPNTLLINDGLAQFSIADDCYCRLEMHAMGSAVADINHDGLPDLYLSDIGGPNLLVSDGAGGFIDTTLAMSADVPAAEDRLSSWGTNFLDINRDRYLDIVLMFGYLGESSEYTQKLDPEWIDGNEQKDVLMLGNAEGTFDLADEAGFVDSDRGRVVVVGDLNSDGRPDLVTAGKHFMKVWHTEGGCTTGIEVTATDGDWNLQGVGGRVTVTVGDVATTQWILPATTGSSSSTTLYFGLAGAPAADSIELMWPDGQTETRADIPAGEKVHFSR